MRLEIVTVIGARPQFIKAAAVSRALADQGLREVIVHTGQHYDEHMSGQFLRELGITNVVTNLEVGSGSHADQTARIMTGFDSYLSGRSDAPAAVVVYGDTNSTLGAAIVASKYCIPIIHIEAGLRSYNRAMPEEINRVVVDHLSDVLFCSSVTGMENLAKEGLRENVHDVGDVMFDAFRYYSNILREHPVCLKTLNNLQAPFVLVTIHRPCNTDDIARMQSVLDGIGRSDHACVWPVHPRNEARLASLRIPANLVCIPPQGYLQMLQLLQSCISVVTDSGGLQKEAYWARRPCITLRNETEWVETLKGGWNRLADPTLVDISTLLREPNLSDWQPLYGDGNAASKIAVILAKTLKMS